MDALSDQASVIEISKTIRLNCFVWVVNFIGHIVYKYWCMLQELHYDKVFKTRVGNK